MTKPPLAKTKGFSLIEIVIVISISTILFLVVAMVYYISQSTYQKTDTRAEIIQNGRVITDRIIRELRQSQSLVTALPDDNSNPATIPSEIIFQDGHDTTDIYYIKYYLLGTDIMRNYMVYYFASDPDTYVYSYDTDQYGNEPLSRVLDTRVIGEYVTDLEFWGNGLVNINLYLNKNSETINISTSIYGRNL